VQWTRQATHHSVGAASVNLKQSKRGNHMAKRRKTKKTKIKRKRNTKKSKPEKLYDPKVDVLKPDVSDAALEREGALSFTRYGCP
jgi:hypothetical protein